MKPHQERERLWLLESRERLKQQVKELEEANDKLVVDNYNLEKEVKRQQDIGQGYYDSMMAFKTQVSLMEERIADTQSRDLEEFMGIMSDYQARQQDDPNFDPRQALHDLYDDLMYIYEKSQDNE